MQIVFSAIKIHDPTEFNFDEEKNLTMVGLIKNILNIFGSLNIVGFMVLVFKLKTVLIYMQAENSTEE